MKLRRRGYLVEGGVSNMMNKLPPDTQLHDMYGMRFSSWDGKLALITGPSRVGSIGHYFDLDLMARRYSVRFAIDLHTKNKINAPTWAIGLDPHPKKPRLSYEQNSFEITKDGGSLRGQPEIKGGFSKPYDFWVKVKLKDLYPGEVSKVIAELKRDDFKDVSRVKLSPKHWKIALKHKTYNSAFNALDKSDASKATTFDRYVSMHNVEWKNVEGVFATSKNKMKFILERD